jgi:hypothetical protein
MTTRPAIGTHSVSGFWPALDGPAAFRRAPSRCHAARARAASVTSPDLTTSLSEFGGSHSTLIHRSALTHTCQCPAEDPTNGLEVIEHRWLRDYSRRHYAALSLVKLLGVACLFAVYCVQVASTLRASLHLVANSGRHSHGRSFQPWRRSRLAHHGRCWLLHFTAALRPSSTLAEERACRRSGGLPTPILPLPTARVF